LQNPQNIGKIAAKLRNFRSKIKAFPAYSDRQN